jgi:hypothetical protein
MKTIMITLILSVALMSNTSAQLSGGWQLSEGNETETMIIAGNYFAVTRYDIQGKKFIGTWGGTLVEGKESIKLSYEFHTLKPEKVGTVEETNFQLKKNTLSLRTGEQSKELSRLDDGKPGALAGAWLITGRNTNGKASTIKPGARRTMKILSGTRFQWIAYNVETREFSGTGGGTYTTVNGKYTENIEFFSRDNTRVGSSLSFDFEMEEGRWRHKGLSSKGDPIDEYWSRRETTGI